MMKSGMSDEEMGATMVNTLLAASEGPAGGLSALFKELSNNDAVQTQAAAEYSECKDDANIEDLSYVTGCVREALRLYSPVTLVQRQADEDTVLEGYKIPKGTLAGVCAAAVHTDEAQFSDAAVFDPLRAGLNHHLLEKDVCFMAFSGGPRGYPGKHLAITLMKVAVCKVLEKFELMPAEQETVGRCYKFVEWPVGG